MKKLMFLTMLFGLFFITAGNVSAQNCVPKDNQVAVYDDWKFGGDCKVLNVGDYANIVTAAKFENDVVSSVKVGKNVKAMLCEHIDFGGVCQTFEADNEFLEGSQIENDRVSSIKVIAKNAASGNQGNNNPTNTSGNVVTFNSFGKVKTGMTVSQASEALGTELVGKAEEGIDCYYVNPKQGFKGVRFMVTNKTIARIEIESKAYATDKGAKIGDTEARIKSLYKGVKVSPQKYDEKKHDMEVYSNDKKYLIIFETDGKRVTGFRAGKAEEVGFVEGCS